MIFFFIKVLVIGIFNCVVNFVIVLFVFFWSFLFFIKIIGFLVLEIVIVVLVIFW